MAENVSLTSSNSSIPLQISVFSNQSSLYQSFPEQSAPVFHITISSEVQEQSIVPYVGAAIVVFFVWFVGSCANGVMIVTFITRRVLMVQQPVFLLLLNLSLADFVICFFGTPTMFISAVNRGWAFSQTVCNLYAFGMSTAGVMNACTVAVVAVERYCIMKQAVRTPQRNRQILGMQLSTSVDSRTSNGTIQGSTYRMGSKGNTGLMLPPLAMIVKVACIWLYALGVSVQPYFGWSDFVVEGIGFSCAPRWGTVAGGWRVLSYSIFLMITAFCLPCGAVVVCYTLLVRHVKSSSMVGQQHFEDRISRLKKLTSLMIAVFVSTWLPYALFSLFVMIGYEEYIPLWLGSLPVVWCKFSVMVNPFVYYFTVAKLRTAIRKTLSSFWRRCRKVHSRASSSNDSSKPSKSQPAIKQTPAKDMMIRSPSERSANSSLSRRTSVYPTAVETALTCSSVEHSSVVIDEKDEQEDVGGVYCGSDTEEITSLKTKQKSANVSTAITETKQNSQSVQPSKSPQQVWQLSSSISDLTKPIELLTRETSAIARQTCFATAVPLATVEKAVALAVHKKSVGFHEEENVFCRYCNHKTLKRNHSSPSTPSHERARHVINHAKSPDSAVQSTDEVQPPSVNTTPVHDENLTAQQQRNRNRNRRRRAKSKEKRKSYAQIAAERKERGYSTDMNGSQSDLNTHPLLSSQFVILRLLGEDETIAPLMDGNEVRGALVTSVSKLNFLSTAAAGLGQSIVMPAAERVAVGAASMVLGERSSRSHSPNSDGIQQSDSGNGISVAATPPCSEVFTGDGTLHYTWV